MRNGFTVKGSFLNKMTSDEMFSKFFQYFFMLNGLPVYYSDRKKSSFPLWYLWRIFIVIRYNVELLTHISYMFIMFIFPYSIFGFIDVAVSAFIVDSLIGKHRRLIDLQKAITDDLVNKNYSISPEDRCKMRGLQTFFGVNFVFSIIILIYGLYRYSLSPFQTMTIPIFAYVFLISVTSWLTTVSSTLFYCIFCKHLMAMFKSINEDVEKLGKISAEENAEFEKRKRVKSHCCATTEACSIFPGPVAFCPKDYPNSSATLSLPLINKVNKIFEGQKDKILASNAEDYRRFSCSILESPKVANPLQIQCVSETYKSPKKNVKHSNSLTKKIQKWNQKFASVALLVQETDDLFSLQVLTILTITFLRSCSYIYLYLSSDWPKYDCCATLSITQQIFSDFLAFGSVAMEASLVTEEARKFSRLINSIEGVFKSKSMKVQVQSDVAALTVYAFDVQLTAWKFFTVSRNFMPTVIGVTATYILIIFQFHQIVQESQCDSLKNMTDTHFLNATLELSLT